MSTTTKKPTTSKKSEKTVKSAVEVVVEKSKPFANIVGQEAHKLAVSNMIAANSNGHPIPGMIFYGERGSGKTTIMREVVKALRADVILPLGNDDLDTLPTPNKIRGENGDLS